MPKKIQEATTSLKLIRKFALVGAFTPQLDESVVPVVLIDDLTESDQWRDVWVGRILTAGGAGNFNKFGVSNPAGSGVVMALDEVGYTADAIESCHFEWPNAFNILSGPLTPLFRDSRMMFPVPVLPACGAAFEQSAGAELGTDEMPRRMIANTPTVFHPDVTLYPGSSIILRGNVANIAGSFYALWRERNLRSDGS